MKSSSLTFMLHGIAGTNSLSSTRRPSIPSTCPSPVASSLQVCRTTSAQRAPSFRSKGLTHVMFYQGATDESILSQARRICMIMGEYFQIQDDYLDCFGDPQVIGKVCICLPSFVSHYLQHQSSELGLTLTQVGTDIQDNKCSWLVVQALQRATPAQRKVSHYSDTHRQRGVKEPLPSLRIPPNGYWLTYKLAYIYVCVCICMGWDLCCPSIRYWRSTMASTRRNRWQR